MSRKQDVMWFVFSPFSAQKDGMLLLLFVEEKNQECASAFVGIVLHDRSDRCAAPSIIDATPALLSLLFILFYFNALPLSLQSALVAKPWFQDEQNCKKSGI